MVYFLFRRKINDPWDPTIKSALDRRIRLSATIQGRPTETPFRPISGRREFQISWGVSANNSSRFDWADSDTLWIKNKRIDSHFQETFPKYTCRASDRIVICVNSSLRNDNKISKTILNLLSKCTYCWSVIDEMGYYFKCYRKPTA